MNMNERILKVARIHAVLLSSSWILATLIALWAYRLAPTVPDGVVTPAMLTALHDAWAWYAAGYGLFFIADCGIALLGVTLAAWLAPQLNYRAATVAALFLLSGAIGIVLDVQMLIAAQAFKTSSPLVSGQGADAFLAYINSSSGWLSVATFLIASCATWIVCPLAERAGAGAGWILLTRCLAVFEFIVSVSTAISCLSGAVAATLVSVVCGVIGMPILATVWLVGLLRQIQRP
jgi:hypothetical protein